MNSDRYFELVPGVVFSFVAFEQTNMAAMHGQQSAASATRHRESAPQRSLDDQIDLP